MHTFKDTRGRAWNLEINCDTIEQVQESCGVNLIDLADPESGLLSQVVAFPPLLAKFLFAALAEQAAVLKVDDREFRRGMSGDAIAEALDALLEEIVLFCPRHRREVLQAVRQKNQEVEAAGSRLAMEQLSDPELTRKAVEAIDRKVRRQIEQSLKGLEGDEISAAAENLSASGSSSAAGPPPDSSASPAPDHTPGDASSGSPTVPGSPSVG